MQFNTVMVSDLEALPLSLSVCGDILRLPKNRYCILTCANFTLVRISVVITVIFLSCYTTEQVVEAEIIGLWERRKCGALRQI